MYPNRYRLHEVSAHVLAVLERRRAGQPDWGPEVEARLTADANAALAEAGKQFSEVADDPGYWQRLEHTVRTVVLPRYFQLAKDEQRLEKDKYGLWRGGDFLSRVAYGGAGLLVAVIAWRTRLPAWFEPVPFAFFLGGPLLPDLQVWFARRRYAKKLTQVVDDMRDEAMARDQYRPMLEDAPAPIDPRVGDAQPSEPKKTRTGDN